MRARSAALGFLLLLSTTSASGAGQDAPLGASTENADVAAAAKYEAGVRAAQNGERFKAYEAFLSAWRLKRHFQIAANLGLTELELGMHRDAAEHLDYFRRHAAGASPEDVRLAARMLTEARRHVAAIAVEVSRPGAEIFVDAVPMGQSPINHDLFVEPGRRVVEARLDGFAPVRATVDATAGAWQRLPLELVPARGPEEAQAQTRDGAPAAERSDSASAPPPLWPVGMAASVAAVGLVTGIGFTVAANDAQERVLAANQDLEAARKGTPAGQDVCGGASEPDVCKTVKQRHDEKVTLHNAAVAAYVVGGVAAVGAAGLLIWTLHGGARGSEARVVPVATSRGGGLLVGGTF